MKKKQFNLRVKLCILQLKNYNDKNTSNSILASPSKQMRTHKRIDKAKRLPNEKHVCVFKIAPRGGAGR